MIAAAHAFNYEPNLLARSLYQGKTLTVGVVLPCLTEAYCAQILGGIEDALAKKGYACVVFQHRRSPSTLEELKIRSKQRGVDGLITISTALGWVPHVPMVTISCPGKLPVACNVQLDHALVARLGLEHLIAMGHRHIAVIQGQDESSDAQRRAKAIKQQSFSLGVPIPDSLIEKLCNDEPSIEPGYAATKRLLAKATDFTAIFAFNDYSAIGAIKAFREAGLSVPQDVSVVGVDDIQPAGYHDPSLTTVRQPLADMGRDAASILLESLKKPRYPTDPRTVLISPTLVERSSTSHLYATGCLEHLPLKHYARSKERRICHE